MLVTSRMKNQRGITLMESLIAILISALGVLGILGVQMRTLTDTHSSVRRAQAIRLIDDLSERTKLNANALANINAYVSDWGTPSSPSKKCDVAKCNTAELAAWDLWAWKSAVTAALPLGDAATFLAADESTGIKRQLGVMISWRVSERGGAGTDYTDPFTDLASNATCPTGTACHIQYIQLTTRCTPYALGGTENVIYCPRGLTDK